MFIADLTFKSLNNLKRSPLYLLIFLAVYTSLCFIFRAEPFDSANGSRLAVKSKIQNKRTVELKTTTKSTRKIVSSKTTQTANHRQHSRNAAFNKKNPLCLAKVSLLADRYRRHIRNHPLSRFPRGVVEMPLGTGSI